MRSVVKSTVTNILLILLLPVCVVAEIPQPVGNQFQVNTFTTSMQFWPGVTSDGQGNFVVIWGSYGSFGTDQSRSSIQGQRYDSNGERAGDQFQVNTYTTSHQKTATAAMDSTGNFVVAWDSIGSNGTDLAWYSIQARRACEGACTRLTRRRAR